MDIGARAAQDAKAEQILERFEQNRELVRKYYIFGDSSNGRTTDSDSVSGGSSPSSPAINKKGS
jgi:hypothetical protein